VAVVAHGSGSSADFVRRAFGRACRAAALELVTWDDRTGDVDAVAAELGRLVDATGARVVGGVSLGAHAAVRWAAGRDLDGLLLALPAWTGRPTTTAALSAAAAQDVERDGLDATVARLSSLGWVGAELDRAWRRYDEATLIAALRATARSWGPAPLTMARIRAPAGVVALADDVFHPEDVASTWARCLAAAHLTVLGRDAPADDVAVIGDAAVRGWLRARRPQSLSAPR
jgi:hypothetical protein